MQSSKKVSEEVDFITDSQLRFNTVGDVINFTIRPGFKWNTELFEKKASFAFLLGFMRLPDEVERRPTLQYTQSLMAGFKIRLRYEFRSYEKTDPNSHRFRILLSYKRAVGQDLELLVANELNFNTYRDSDTESLRGFDKNRLSLGLRLRNHPMRPSLGPVYEYLPGEREDEHLLALLLNFHI